MKKLVVLVFILVLTLVVPSLTFAQSADYPDTFAAGCGVNPHNAPTGAGAAGTMRAKVKFLGQPLLDSGGVPVALCDTGSTGATNTLNQLCHAVFAAYPGNCAGDAPADTCVGEAACCSKLPGAVSNIACTFVPAGPDGFNLSRAAGAIGNKITILPFGAAVLTNVVQNTSAGNSMGPDPLPNWLFEIAPGVNGIVTFRVDHTCGGVDPRVFTVDTTGKTTLQISQEVANGFNTLALGCTTLPATVYANEEIVKYTAVPGEFNCQFFVRVTNVNSVQGISVTGQPGQFIVTDGNNVQSSALLSVPSLNLWGVASMVAVLLLTSLWFLRRRMRTV